MSAHTCNETCTRPACVARRRIAELEADNKNAHAMIHWKTLEAEKARDDWRAAEAENQRLREAAQNVVDCMRGSGGINPDAAGALLKLAALLEEGVKRLGG